MERSAPTMNDKRLSDMDILRVNPERRGSDSISDIISRFHKIREDRAAKSPSHLFVPELPHPALLRKSRSQELNPVSSARPHSAAKGELSLGTFGRSDRRRLSVPHIFRPFDGRSSSVTPRQDPPMYKEYRRHSISHAVYEYELAKIREKHKRLANGSISNKSVKTDEEDVRRCLLGKDLHHYYSFWDRPEYVKHRKKLEKLRAVRPFPPLLRELNGDNGENRPRLSSL